MNVLIKKYFWIGSLVVIGVCAIFAGRTSARLVEQRWFMVDDGTLIARRPPPLPLVEKTRTKETEAIIDRNVFCSVCERKVEEESPDGGAGLPGGELRKSELPLELVSTMVVPADERWSMAVVRETASKEKDSGLYKTGSTLPGGSAVVVRVIEKKLYLLNNGRLEYLDIDGGPNVNPQGQTEVGVVRAEISSADPMDGDVDRGVRCTGQRCEIDRGLVEKMLSNTTMLATAARFVPSIKDGRPNGFKLYAIRPSSIFGKIGLQNGDTVKAINGMEMSTPDQALGVYTKVRSASHLTVQVERRGETVTLDYTIR